MVKAPLNDPFRDQFVKQLAIFLGVPTSHEMPGWHPEHECQPRPPFPRSCGEQQGGFPRFGNVVDFGVSELHILLM